MRAFQLFVSLTPSAIAISASANLIADVSLALPGAQPPFAKLIDPALSSFSLEFQYWPVYAGNATGQPNHYVNNLLKNLGNRTGTTPAVRVGGTSQNNAYVDTSFQVWNATQLNEVFGPFNIRSKTAIGRDWYALAGNLPAGTEITFGLNVYEDAQVANQTQMLAEAFQGSRRSLTKGVTLKYIQIGNEPNFYFPNATAFTKQWNMLAQTVMRNVKMGGDKHPSFWVGSEVIAQEFPTPFLLTGTLQAGILDDKNVSSVTTVLEEHLYSGSSGRGAVPGGPPPGTLMDKHSIRGNLSLLYKGVLNVESYNKTYYLGETNTYGRQAIFGLSNTGESAIWTVDYMLKAAAMGIKRVYLHSTPNRLFAVFQPGWGLTNGTGIERPHIMPMYNGLLVVNELIGTSGCSRIAEIENASPSLATYGVWEHNKLQKLVLINSNVFTNASATRPALNITLAGRGVGRQTTVKRLSIPITNSTSGITWAGQSFETESGVPSGHVKAETLNGTAVIVAASEVVLLQFK